MKDNQRLARDQYSAGPGAGGGGVPGTRVPGTQVPGRRSPARQPPVGRGRALFIEALSLSFAREDHQLAAQRLRALADCDTKLLGLALDQCRTLLRGTSYDDPGLCGAARLLAMAGEARPVQAIT